MRFKKKRRRHFYLRYDFRLPDPYCFQNKMNADFRFFLAINRKGKGKKNAQMKIIKLTLSGWYSTSFDIVRKMKEKRIVRQRREVMSLAMAGS